MGLEAIVLDWLSLAFRWIHIITAIAWIGASFYFNWLLNHLLSSDDPKVSGQLWAIHAGGFFNVEKRNIEPGKLPAPLHWFKWESYWTWLSGFTLLVLIYYFGAEAYLIDPSVADLQSWQAIAINLAVLAGGWVFYHFLWNSPFAQQNNAAALLITTLFIAIMAFVLTHIYSGRGAYLTMGAMLATWMTGNVFFVIMPAQRYLVKATANGERLVPSLAKDAGERSLHNNYLTLPVIFAMMSNHYPATFGSQWNWVILIALFVVGVLVRHYFNIREKQGNVKSIWLLAVAALLFIGLAITASWNNLKLALQDHETIAYDAQIKPIMEKHCIACHATQNTSSLFAVAPKGMILETEAQLRTHAASVASQVSSGAMPLGNMSAMTAEERELLLVWLQQVGAK